MFKDISNLFEKRKKLFNKSQDKITQIKNNLEVFLKEKFGDNLKGFVFKINYDSREDILTIDTGNKIIANELALRLSDLQDFLKKENVKPRSILIR